jgi:SAM-dependent methyltransferase
VPDAAFDDPRLAHLYDRFEGERPDLDVYASIVEELGAHRVLDLGCGTGTFALALAQRGLEVVGVDPAEASLLVARGKPGAEAVRWIHGDATSVSGLAVDLVTLTGNVAQAIVDPGDWDATLRGVREALRPGGYLVFETRDPADRAWEDWTPTATRQVVDLESAGRVERWIEVTAVRGDLVTFRATFAFADGQLLVSDSTLRFRQRGQVEADLTACGYDLAEVRGAPDRPGRELVFVARRANGEHGC